MNANIKVIDVLDQAVDQGISIFLEDGKLKLKVNKTQKPDPEFINLLRAKKEDITSFLAKEAETIQSINSGQAPLLAFDRSKVDRIPLSFAQERMWFIDKLSGSLHYHMPKVLKIKGQLEPSILELSIQEIINRHEVLRTVFGEEEGQPYQLLLEKDAWQLSYREVGAISKYGLDQIIDTEVNQAFDLIQDYMLRGHLLKHSAEEYTLILVFHHIASDGWSDTMFLKELMALYEAGIKGQNAQLAPLPVQYADFSYWQRNYLQGEVLEQKLQYWENRLSGVEELNLPLDFPRPDVKSSKGKTFNYKLNKELSENLNQLAQEEGLTSFMLMLGAFKLLLHKYTGQEDICVGTPIANRTQEEIEPLIGLFLNTLALRSDFSDNPTFTDFLAKVKSTALEAYSNQDLPFEKIVDRVEKKRDMRRSPLFQVMFVLHNNPKVDTNTEGKEEGLSISAVPFEYETAKFDLTLFVHEAEEGMSLVFEYCTDLFLPESIELMAQHFEILLNEVVQHPKARIGDFNMLKASEKELLLNTFNDTSVAYPQDQTLVDLFTNACQRTPDKTAVEINGDQLTYQELDTRSTQLANYLLESGLASGSMVGVCIDRSLEMIIGILAILKSGGAYVPLDPEYPQERIKNILEDTQIQYVLSKTYLKKNLPFEDLHISTLDTFKFEEFSSQIPAITKDLKQLTYVIFTSGSTGRPKGVKMHNDALVNLLYWQQEQCFNKFNRRTLQFASLNFDVSFQEIFSTLCFSGTLFLIEEEKRKDARALLDLIQKASVSHIFVPFVVLDNLADFASSEKIYPTTLEEVITAGEQLKLTDAIQDFISQTSSILVNQYGPSESHVVSAYEVVESDFDNKPLPPIGKPIANTQLYVLDTYGNPCPVKTLGELYIGGIALSSGYVNRDQLTAEKFIALPIDGKPTQLYKTGDIACWLPDGNIEFLGRKDDQVKIRGHRVELGEVESTFLKSPLVFQCVVLAKKDPAGNKRLVAYVVPEGAYDKDGIMNFVKSVLPEYMVPALIMEMEKLPVTPNGKVAKRALPDPDASALIANQYQAPSTELEVQLAEIWKNLLKVEKVGVYDNFFELGGHSLLATRVVSAIRKELNLEISIRAVFTQTTIAQLAMHLEQEGRSNLLPAITVQRRPERIPLSYAQERLWFIDQLSGTLSYHIPLVLRFTGQLNAGTLEHAFKTIINRHEVLRTVYREEEGVGYQVLLDTDLFSLSFIDKNSVIDLSDLESLVENEINYPFNLSEDHPIRAKLIKLTEEDHVLVLVIHHIASDGWSMPIFMAEMAEIYAALNEGRNNRLPDLKIQYADVALWQKQYLEGEVLEQKLNYWEQKLTGIKPLNLPTDFNRPALQSNRGASIKCTLPKALTEELLNYSKEEGVSLFMLLLSSFKVLLNKYTGQTDICVGTPIANRTQAEVEPLIGFFVNNLALRSQVNAQHSFNEFLHEVKQTTLEAYDHQEVPFEKIVDRVEEARDRSRSSLFQVSFVLQNNPEAEYLEVGEDELLRVSTETFGYEVSKYDLSMWAEEGEEGLSLGIVYCTDLFQETTIERMMQHYKVLLRDILEFKTKNISELSILTKKEENVLLHTWNATQSEYPLNETLISLFEAQVQKKPEAKALSFEDNSYSYAQLNALANQFGHFLLEEYQIQKEGFVGLKIDRSEWMAIAILAVLKTGAAYVPIDPDYPESRIEYIIRDSECKVLVDEHLINQFKEQISQFSTENLPIALSSDQLAYMIYTSGSTGLPKGCMIEHQSVVNYLFSQRETLNFRADENILHLANIAFDPSVEQLFLALCHGACVTIASKEAMLQEGRLAEILQEEEISHLHTVPSLLQTISFGRYPSLRRVISAGEACRKELADQWSSQYDFYNKYGPTEATISSLEFRYNADSAKNANVPIGNPLGNTTIDLLDENEALVPVGVVGEICIGGKGLSRGYWKKEELNAQKFVLNPYREKELMYKTGDLASRQEDGSILFLGRKDSQVKIRGHRVELGEIENSLSLHPDVVECAISAKTQADGTTYLLAYVVTKEDFEKTAVQQFLKSKLPSYMIPAIWVELDSLPLNPNGKVDHNALPEPEQQALNKKDFVGPSNEVEEAVYAVWASLLPIKQISVYDNFFDLGGHSLLALRTIARINKRLSTTLPVAHLFEFPTIASFCENIQETESDEAKLMSFNQSMGKSKIYAIPGAEGNAMVFYDLAQSFEGVVDLFAIQPQGRNGQLSPVKTVEAMAKNYIDLLLEDNPEGPYQLLGYSFGARVVYEMASQMEQRGLEVSQVIIIDAIAPHKNIKAPVKQIDYSFWLSEIASVLAHLYGKQLSMEPAEFTQASKLEMFEYLHQKLESIGLDLPFQQIKGLSELYISNVHCSYVPKVEPPLNCPIKLFKATEVSEEQLAAWEGIMQKEDYGWQELTREPIEIITVASDHWNILNPTEVTEITENLELNLLSKIQSYHAQ